MHCSDLETARGSGPTAEPIVEIDDFGAPSAEESRGISWGASPNGKFRMVHVMENHMDDNG